jgi:hypothetical protein
MPPPYDVTLTVKVEAAMERRIKAATATLTADHDKRISKSELIRQALDLGMDMILLRPSLVITEDDGSCNTEKGGR